MSTQDATQDRRALLLLIKSYPLQSQQSELRAIWWTEVKRGYIPLFLAQKALVGAYALSVGLSWLAAFWYDTKLLRKERKL